MSAVIVDVIDTTILERFRLIQERKRLAHAYLLVGPKGCGKLATALAIAKMVMCQAEGLRPCGQCPVCLKIDSQNHPDVFLCNRGDDQTIKILKVREIIQRMQLRPYEADVKIVMIDGVDLLTTEASNAFLKTLEEPSENSLLLLTTSSLDRVFDTIKSRCQIVHFFGSPRLAVSDALSRHGVTDEREALLAAGFSEGCYGKALQLKDRGFFFCKNDVIDQFVFRQADEKFLKWIVSDLQRSRDALDALLFCFKDMLWLKIQGGENWVTNVDRLGDLKQCAARYSDDQLKEIFNVIVNIKKMLDGNLNIKIPFMVLKEKIWTSK